VSKHANSRDSCAPPAAQNCRARLRRSLWFYFIFFFDKFKYRNMISFFLERYQPLAVFSLHESRGTWHLQPVKWHLLKRQLLIHIRILFARLESVCLCASKVDNVCASAWVCECVRVSSAECEDSEYKCASVAVCICAFITSLFV